VARYRQFGGVILAFEAIFADFMVGSSIAA
jgi:hypothetical protein